MKKRKKNINIKSNSGFTMTDLVTAIIIFTLFTGVIGTLLYSAFKVNLQTKLSAASLNYAIQILEDIDKITYEEVKNGIEDTYKEKFSIPEGFDLKVEVSNYNQGNSKEDLVKTVKLTITYEFSGSTENLVIHKLKVKEV